MSTDQTQHDADAARATVLVIDDEDAICFAFRRYFGARGFRVQVAGTGRDGRARCRELLPDVLFLDVRLPDCDGLDLLDELHEIAPECCIIVITAYGSLDAVTRAIRGRAFDHLTKPIDLDQAHALVEQILASRRSHGRPSASADPQPTGASALMIGGSPAMEGVFKAVGRAAATDSAVLVTGATGTGKERVARAIHQLSRRARGPFVAVNCGALPEQLIESELFGCMRGAFTGADADRAGRFELADHGTLFLDEVGELPRSAQVKLLRFLDCQTVERLGGTAPIHLDVRVVAATNKCLQDALATGEFRSDLYYRLAVIEIDLPSLEHRRGDILDLASHFIAEPRPGSPAPSLSPDAARVLTAFDWPGNVRQLRNAIEHALAMSSGSTILPLHLPRSIRASTEYDRADMDALQRAVQQLIDVGGTRTPNAFDRIVRPLEEALIRRVLAETDGNQSEAATLLGLHRNTLRRRLTDLGL